MSASRFSFLAFGYDTVEVAYYLDIGRSELDCTSLIALRDSLRQDRKTRTSVVRLGSKEFLFQAYGMHGYPLVALCKEWIICFGPTREPSFFVKFYSAALWQYGLEQLHRMFLDWGTSAKLFPKQLERLSRVDPCFDYFLHPVDFERDHIVTRAIKNNQYREGDQTQTFNVGAGPIRLRLYDKVSEIGVSGKTWLFQIWNCDRNVWRCEWQARKEIMRRFAICTVADLMDGQGDMLTWLTTHYATLRVPTADSNKSRWPLHPLWADIQSRAASLPRLGVDQSFDPEAAIPERLSRLGKIMVGYLKRIACLYAVLHGRPAPTFPEAIEMLVTLLRQSYDRHTWHGDVAQMMDETRLRP